MRLRFALGRKKELIDGFDKQYLAMLGFSLKSSEDQLAVADVAGKARKDRSKWYLFIVVVKGVIFSPNRLKEEE
jgi:hypothetical protein